MFFVAVVLEELGGEIKMETEIKDFSPIYEIFRANSEDLETVISMATEESALKMGENFFEAFSFYSNHFQAERTA